MPRLNSPTLPDRKDVTVEQLLRLKKAERPDAEFWEGFDRQMQQRVLQTLVNRRRGVARRVLGYVTPMRHALIPGMATLLVVGGVVLQSPGRAGLAETPAAAASIKAEPMAMVMRVEASMPRRNFDAPADAAANRRFVVDSLRAESQASGYMKVMATEAFNIPIATSTRYVADPLTGSASRFLAAGGSY
jgi:hypothetical protein